MAADVLRLNICAKLNVSNSIRLLCKKSATTPIPEPLCTRLFEQSKPMKIMKQFRVFKISNMWATSRLTRDVEKELKRLTDEGYDIISVSFSVNIWWIPTAFITTSKAVKF